VSVTSPALLSGKRPRALCWQQGQLEPLNLQEQ